MYVQYIIYVFANGLKTVYISHDSKSTREREEERERESERQTDRQTESMRPEATSLWGLTLRLLVGVSPEQRLHITRVVWASAHSGRQRGRQAGRTLLRLFPGSINVLLRLY